MKAKNILIISAREATEWGTWPAGYEAVFANGDEAAIELAQQHAFEAIVIDGTDAVLHHLKLNAILPILQPDAALFRYSGNKGQSLQAEVQEHFRRERNARIRRYLVLDSASFNGPELPHFSAN
jgi:hypothetical protein